MLVTVFWLFVVFLFKKIPVVLFFSFLAVHRVFLLLRMKDNTMPYKDPTSLKAKQNKSTRQQKYLAKKKNNLVTNPMTHRPIVCIDGENSTDGVYDLFQLVGLYQGELRSFTIGKPNIPLTIQDIHDVYAEVDNYYYSSFKVRPKYYAFSFGYDADQLIFNTYQTKKITDDEAWMLLSQRKNSYGTKRTIDWSEYFIKNARAYYFGRKVWKFAEAWDIHIQHLNPKKKIREMRTEDVYTLEASAFLYSVVPTIEKNCNDHIYQPDIERHLRKAIALVVEGKAARGQFIEHNINVKAYNTAEMVLLCYYIEHMYVLCGQLEITPSSLAGPAPLARQLMTKYGAKNHIKPDNYDTVDFHESPLMKAGYEAYKGGRIELLGIGVQNGYEEYDINSAYPSIQSHLPCMAHGEWIYKAPGTLTQIDVQHYIDNDPIQLPTMVYAALIPLSEKMVNRPDSDATGPFAYRDTRKSISYPLSFPAQWIWTPEIISWVRTAQSETLPLLEEYAPDYLAPYLKTRYLASPNHENYFYPYLLHPDGSLLVIYSSYSWQSQCPVKEPFGYMRDIYIERQKLKRENNPAQMVLKLALNSSYGVLCQRAGSYTVQINENDYTYHTPAYSNIFGGGVVTSAVRGKIYELIRLAPKKSVIATATDSIKTKKGALLSIPVSTRLGDFSYELHESPTVFVQSGFHVSKDGKVVRVRGYATGTKKDIEGKQSNTSQSSITFDNVVSAVASNGSITVSSRMYRSGSQSVRYAQDGLHIDPEWGTFQTVEKTIDCSFNALRLKRNITGLTMKNSHFTYAPPFVRPAFPPYQWDNEAFASDDKELYDVFGAFAHPDDYLYQYMNERHKTIMPEDE